MKRVHMTLVVAVAAILAGGPALAASDFERGNELYAKGQFQAACDAYIDSICAKPKYYPAHYQMGNALMKLGKFADAQTEYEMTLEMYPDAATKANCKKALKFLTGTAIGKAAVTPEAGENQLNQKLAIEGERRAQQDALRVERDKLAIEKAGKDQAAQIKNAAKAQLEAVKQNSNCWVMDREKNDRVPMIHPEVEYQIMTRADAQAAKAIEKANAKAKAETSSGATDVTDGLRSQIYQQGNSNVRLSPVGTNVYVRNYQSMGKEVASTNNGVK